VTARIWWATDNVQDEPDKISPYFDLERFISSNELFDVYYPGRELKYELWLDGPIEFDPSGTIARSGDILVTREDGRYVGGVWKNGSSPAMLINTHPDYMWIPFGVQHSTGYKNPNVDDAWIRDNIGAPRQGI
jgi:hypothetical protein